MNAHKIIVLLFAVLHLLTSLLYASEYFLPENKKHQIEKCECKTQTESEKTNNINLKNEVSMEKKTLESETVASQSNTANVTKNKSTVEVHQASFQ